MNRLRRLFHKSRAETELDKELRFHLEQQIAHDIGAGANPEEARRRTCLEFGGLERVKEDVRETRWETHLDNLVRDFRYGFRTLRKDRRFAFVAILTLALGIASTTIMLSVIYDLLVDPLPYEGAARLVVINIHDFKQGGENDRQSFSLPEFLDYRKHNHVFEDVVGGTNAVVSFDNGSGTTKFGAAYVTGNTFEFFGVPPLLGRGITPDDAKPDAPPVFAMNYKIWKSEFASDPAILGKTYFVEGKRRTLVGIMPERFQAFSARLWFPMALIPGAEGTTVLGDEAFVPYSVVSYSWRTFMARTSVDAASVLKGMATEVQSIDPGIAIGESGTLETSLREFYRGPQFELVTLTAFSAIGLILVVIGIFCVMAPVSLQTHEIGIRMALGAQPRNILRLVLLNGFRLVAAGIPLGLLASYALTRLLISQISGVSTTDPRTFAAVAALVVLVGLVACLLPARRAASVDPLIALRYE